MFQLETLAIDDTLVVDLRALGGLSKLVAAPDRGGLTFMSCAAADADLKIAKIAEIEDAKERAAALFRERLINGFGFAGIAA